MAARDGLGQMAHWHRCSARAFHGYWQASEYAFWQQLDGMPVRRPLSKMMLKSAIALPAMCESVPAGQSYSVYGAAWSDG